MINNENLKAKDELINLTIPESTQLQAPAWHSVISEQLKQFILTNGNEQCFKLNQSTNLVKVMEMVSK